MTLAGALGKDTERDYQARADCPRQIDGLPRTLKEGTVHLGLRIVQRSIGTAVFSAIVWGSAQAATLHLNARTIYECAVSSNITLSEDGSTLRLKSGEVFQDDGPASGFSYKPTQETLSPGVEVRKQLLIPNPRASRVVLMVGPGGDLKVVVNGKTQKTGAPQAIY